MTYPAGPALAGGGRSAPAGPGQYQADVSHLRCAGGAAAGTAFHRSEGSRPTSGYGYMYRYVGVSQHSVAIRGARDFELWGSGFHLSTHSGSYPMEVLAFQHSA